MTHVMPAPSSRSARSGAGSARTPDKKKKPAATPPASTPEDQPTANGYSDVSAAFAKVEIAATTEACLAELKVDMLPDCSAWQDQAVSLLTEKMDVLVPAFVHYCKVGDCSTLDSAMRFKIGAPLTR